MIIEAENAELRAAGTGSSGGSGADADSAELKVGAHAFIMRLLA